MPSVTRVADQCKQPYGGYIKAAWFEKTQLSNAPLSLDAENISPILVGLAVDYLTRFQSGLPKEEAFGISLAAAEIADHLMPGRLDEAREALDGISGLDKESIVNACKIVSFDVWRRSILAAMTTGSHLSIPNSITVDHIRRMVQRSMHFLKLYGPVVSYKFTFDPPNGDVADYISMKETGEGRYGGYTPAVSSGDGDFHTKDTIWDFKVSKRELTSKQTLQLLMYYIMGKHSDQKQYETINKLGVYNPRLDTVYLLETERIPKLVFKRVGRDVLKYTEDELMRVRF